MTRQQLLWLFIWILFFFILFCIWRKLPEFTSKIAPQPTQVENIQTPLKKQMHFKLLKNHDSVTISGIVPDENAKTKIVDAYGKVFKDVQADNLLIEPNVKESYLIDFFADFADNFSHFNTGYLDYSNETMEIDGSANNKIVQYTLQEQLALLKNVKVHNTFSLEEMGQTQQKESTTVEKIPEKQEAPLSVQERLNNLLTGKRVQFLYARDILTKDSQILVDKIIEVLKENPQVTIEISGHTDSDGTKKNNLRLSQRRAQSVKNYMVSKGIAPSQLKAVGYGESQPLVKNNTLKNRQINRRVEFKVMGE
jgi:outer membrane protein OmpA-like peptidoglycan-associated protein